MATSGTAMGNITNPSRENIFSYYMQWNAVQNVSGNYSDVTVITYLFTSNSNYTFDTVSTRKAKITIDGTETEESARINCNPWTSNPYEIMRATQRVYHNSDGTKSLTISASSYAYANSGSSHYGAAYDASSPCTVSDTVTLDTISRYATITSAPTTFTDESNPTIYYNNPLGNNATSLMACISFDGSTAAVPYRNLPMTGTNYTFALTSDERTILRNNTPGSSATVYFLLKTVSGGSAYTSTFASTLTIQGSGGTEPTLTVSLSPVAAKTIPSAWSDQYIQSRSQVSVLVSASPSSGATLPNPAQITFSWDSGTYTCYSGDSVLSPIISGKAKQTVTVSITDSRGHTKTDTYYLTVRPYSAPQVVPATGESEVLCYRSDSQGTPDREGTQIWVKAKMTYQALSGGGLVNTATLRWRTCPNGSWNTLIVSSSGSTYDGLLPDLFEVANSYTIEIGVIDTFSEENSIIYVIPTKDVVLHLAEGGRGVGIGRLANSGRNDSLSVAWDAYFESKFYIMERELSLSADFSVNGNIADLPNKPTSVSDGCYFTVLKNGDKYYLLISSSGGLHIGIQASGSSTITWAEK